MSGTCSRMPGGGGDKRRRGRGAVPKWVRGRKVTWEAEADVEKRRGGWGGGESDVVEGTSSYR
jgi:hypothetical protein